MKFKYEESIEYELLTKALEAHNQANPGKEVIALIGEEPDYFRISLSHLPQDAPNLSEAHVKMMHMREGNGNVIQIKSVFHEIIHKLLRHGLKDLVK